MTLTDDDLGARLRTALQRVTPLATDPVPPPCFAIDAEPRSGPPGIAEPLRLVAAAPGAPPRRPGRRPAVAVVLLAGAAVAVAVSSLASGGAPRAVSGRAGGGPGGASVSNSAVASGPSGSTRAPSASADPRATVPDRGGADLGITTDVPYRCTAPAGATLSADIDRTQVTPTVWRIGPGMTCVPWPQAEQTVSFSADGMTVSYDGTAPTGSAEGPFCTYIATGALGVPLSFTSRGPSDYIEFHGSGCRLQLPAR